MKRLAIDPGNVFSGFAIIQEETYEPLEIGKVTNGKLLELIDKNTFSKVAIEKIASYGMAVGEHVFDTCIWTGRFLQMTEIKELPVVLIKRNVVKNHLCHSSKAKDSNIRQALIDRFAVFDFKNGKGTKKCPDWFYGFKADIWQAYALGVTSIDLDKENDDEA